MRPAGPFLVGRNSTLRDTFEKIESGACGIALLVDTEGRLIRTVTDGDLRRLILGGADLASPLSRLPERASVTASAGIDPTRALEILNEHKIDHLPLTDAAGCPVGVYFRRDIDAQILLSTPHMGSYEREYVEEAFRTNWIAPLGPNVDAFEKELAAYVGIGHAAAVVSGTAALHLALRLLGVGRGDRVFCSSLTFVASANPILYEGAVPVFIDSEPESWNMSPGALERALEDAARRGALPRAVIVVNLYGQSADMDPLLELCGRYSVPIVEDAAESLGATYRGRKSGTFGRLGTFSFNGNKIITTSGGGMLVSEDEDLIRHARKLSTQAREPAGHYEHVEVGYNYRMSNVLAGIGRGQLRVIDDRVRARRRIFARYVEALGDVPEISWMPDAAFGTSTHWLTAATLEIGVSPAEFIEALSAHRIEARRLWKPMHLQPLFSQAEYFPHSSGRDVSASLFDRGICLPSGSNMTDEQQDRIIDSVRSLVGRG
jgi:dTDP-4-amino-4,6-dideoxygalactose transaminase